MPFKEFYACIPANGELVIWRYMDLFKFEDILKKQALFFCRADKFSDPFEGSLPKREADYRIVDRRNRTKMAEQAITESIEALSSVHKMFKRKHIVNCWHIDNYENDSMWRLYLKDTDGIAIKTTVNNLIKSLDATIIPIYCSKVRYLDFEEDIWYNKDEYPHQSYSLFTPLIHKRIELRNEAELRLIHSLKEDNDEELDLFWSQQESDKGIYINIDIETLIDSVFCCPTCEDSHIYKINSLCNQYGFNFRVEKSKLSQVPIY